MKMIRTWCAIAVLALAGVAGAQERPYTEGPVTIVTSVKVMDGQYENYMKFLAGNWRRAMEASKEAGIVQEFHVFKASPRRPEDADLYLVETYSNMAAFDGMNERMDPIMAKVMKMNVAQLDEASGKRTVMRTILGSEMLRELILK
jgi:hypothetical protein